MSQIASHDEVAPTRNQKELPGGHLSWRTYFLKPPREARQEQPVAFLAESTAQRVLRTHFHDVDQWQIVVKGGGTLGKHDLQMYAVHFARAHTPYGPIVNGPEGLGFLTLRHHWDDGAKPLPESQEKLMQVKDRKPWQMTEAPDFGGDEPVNLRPFSQIKDERGLAAFALQMQPGVSVVAPDPAGSGGQFIVVLEGSLRHAGREYPGTSVAFVGADEAPWELVAGGQGLKALVLNFSRQSEALPAAEKAAKGSVPGNRLWRCMLCAFVYDEAQGMPDEGIAPGTRWEDVPEDWYCPDCSAGKSDFEMELVG